MLTTRLLRCPTARTALLVLVTAVCVGHCIICYDCHNEAGTCNEGECEGTMCSKMETANKDNDRKTIQKSCIDGFEESGCKLIEIGSKTITKCACESPLCNGDQALFELGMAQSSSPTPSGSFSQMALLVAVLIFIGASCSILVISTICVQFF